MRLNASRMRYGMERMITESHTPAITASSSRREKKKPARSKTTKGQQWPFCLPADMIICMDASDELSGLPNQDPDDSGVNFFDELDRVINADPGKPLPPFSWDEQEHAPFMSVVCLFCAHLSQNVARQCAAFEHIPDDIWHARNDHRKPYPGDHGIQFAPREEKASEE